MMPELDGFGLVAAVRGDDRTRSIPVILLSARAGEEARIEGLRAGADEYLVKPFSARELLASVTSQLQLAEVRRESMRLLQENADVTETLNNVGAIVASDLDRTKVVQAVTDAATELTTARVRRLLLQRRRSNAARRYTLYTISGVPREAFSKFPMPRNTEVFEPTFKGTGVVRSEDITKDPRYGHNAPYYGMPPGHLPVRSYLAVPVKGRAGEVIGGLFFGHSAGRPSSRRSSRAPRRWHRRMGVRRPRKRPTVCERPGGEPPQRRVPGQVVTRTADAAQCDSRLRAHAGSRYRRARTRETRAIATIERNATSLTQIVEDVLDISRIVSGKIRLNVQPVDLPDIVRNAIDAIAPAADAKGVRVEIVLDPGGADLWGSGAAATSVVEFVVERRQVHEPRR